MRRVAIAVFVLASAVGCALGADPGTSGHEPPCMDCHRPKNTVIDPVQFAHSVHGNLQCEDCHTQGFDRFPHPGSAADMPDCKDCHSGTATPPIDFDKIAAAVAASVHVQAVDPAFRCTNCHSPHSFIPASRMSDPSQALHAANNSCLHCHASGATPAAQDLAFKQLVQKHKLFPHWELHIERNECVACHTPRGQQSVHQILPKSGALRDCSVCHAKNSLLVTKLYSHLAVKERAERGWVNAVLTNDSYMTGATRNRWMDWSAGGLAGIVILGVAAHGAGRLAFRRFRRKA